MSQVTLGSVVLIPVSELLSRVVVQIAETAHAIRTVLIEKESFLQLSSYLEKLTPILTQIQLKKGKDTPTVRIALECLGRELQNAKDLVDVCGTRSKFYLLVNCRSMMKKLQQITNDIGRALSLMPLAHLDLSSDFKEKTRLLFQEMQDAEFKMALVAEEVADKIESGLRDHRQSSNFSNDLLMQIAKAVKVDLGPLSLKKELEQLKKEKEAADLQKNRAEALQLEQIAALLSWADAASSLKEREKQYHDKRVTLGTHPFPPLQSFYCPITQEVMEDPVEVASGHTFERAAIQKWFAEGHTTCPVSFVDMISLDLKPNVILKRSINEWKERNIVIRLTTMGPKLNSEDEEVVFATLDELYGLCEVKSTHRHWIAAEGLVPVLVNLLKSSKSSVRKRTLATLTMIVKDNLDNKGRACEVGVVTFAVRSLAREVSESRQAVALLREISKERKLCKQLNKVQGCILLLVTMTNCEIQQAAEDARIVLENLSKCKEQNVVLMAEANYFNPLVQHLTEGSDMTQIIMANAVSRMQLTDQSRGVLVQLGLLPPLVKMVSEGNFELKSAALGALQNLSKLPENRDSMVEAGVVKLLLELLFTTRSVLMTIKEQAAVVFANLAVATTKSCDGTLDLLGKVLEPNEIIYQLLSLLNLTGPVIQSQLLRALIGISCPPSAQGLRTTMREAGAVELLVGFYMVNSNTEVRLYALKLLHLLTQDGGGEALAREMGMQPVVSLVKLLTVSSPEDAKETVMGILHNIPIDNKSTTEMMVEAGLLPVIMAFLQKATSNVPIKKELLENATGVLMRFTLPSNLPLQQLLVTEHGVIPMLLHLLKSGTPLTKCRAAVSLGQLSESTIKQTSHVKKVTRFWCTAPQVDDDVCKVHGGVCSVEKSFCLVEAQALPVLIQILAEQEPAAIEAALGALATLLYDEFWERGADVIAEARGIGPIVRLLTTGTPRVQESAVWILERFFRKERYRMKYGRTAQMALISLTQDGTNKTRHYAARILAHLNILQEQSSYF